MAEAETPTAVKSHCWSVDDEAAIKRTIHDYFDGWFEGDASRMKRALHPSLAKQTLATDENSRALNTVTAQEMIDATDAGVGTRQPQPCG